ncbi:MAG: hypothetical protein WCA89_15345 [Terracidiphilus sp.]|jgi:tetratricopeptide (TPR) repeat protein
MLQVEPTEEEIDAVEKLRVLGDFETVLALTQDMLSRAQDEGIRMRLLFDVLNCSTRLDADNVTENAMKELEKLPKPEFSRVLANLIRAKAEIDLGRPQEGLKLIDMNLETGFFEREDFRVHKYQLCLFRGQALVRLSRWDEAFEWLEKAHAMYPSRASTSDDTTFRIYRWVETEILLNKAHCMIGLNRFDEAYELSKQAYEREEGDTKTLAMLYMANCRTSQGKMTEALNLFIEIQKKLPCRTVRDENIQDGIEQCMDYREKCKPQSNPS